MTDLILTIGAFIGALWAVVGGMVLLAAALGIIVGLLNTIRALIVGDLRDAWRLRREWAEIEQRERMKQAMARRGGGA